MRLHPGILAVPGDAPAAEKVRMHIWRRYRSQGRPHHGDYYRVISQIFNQFRGHSFLPGDIGNGLSLFVKLSLLLGVAKIGHVGERVSAEPAHV